MWLQEGGRCWREQSDGWAWRGLLGPSGGWWEIGEHRRVMAGSRVIYGEREQGLC